MTGVTRVNRLSGLWITGLSSYQGYGQQGYRVIRVMDNRVIRLSGLWIKGVIRGYQVYQKCQGC